MIADRSMKTGVLLAASILSMAGQTSTATNGGPWLITKTTGRCQFRRGDKIFEFVDGYHGVDAETQVRCLNEKKGEDCKFVYLYNFRSGGTAELVLKPLPGQRWRKLQDLNLRSAEGILSKTPLELVEDFDSGTDRGGSRSGSLCGGDLELRAPVCGETVDISDFRIRWLAKAEDHNRNVSVLIERVDGTSSRYRATAPADRGEYTGEALLDYLKKQQTGNDPVDISVTVMAGGKSAVRLVHIPPSARTERYHLRVRETEDWDPFCRRLQWMSLAMHEGMWSKAAEQAGELLNLAPDAPELREYALAGLCQSDFEEQKTLLRSELPVETYNRLCKRPTSAIAVPEKPAVQAGTVRTREAANTRLGIAILIGNSDYWNLPLASVKSDVRQMSATLESLGFQVAIRENLKYPQQFEETLADVLRKENASPDDVLLVYYSGHGLQLDGKAYLLGTGVSATAQVAEDVRANAQSAEGLLAEMERAAPAVRILIIEACRNNVFSAPAALGGQNPRAGFAFQQDDVPNTVVMFANRPGLPTPVRSDYGLMGPFTESLIHALNHSSGLVQEVFEMAQSKTAEISPGQEPVMYTSKKVDRIVLRQREPKQETSRAADLLNSAATLYRDQAWDQFRVTVGRARALVLDPEMQQRLTREVEFVGLVLSAGESEQQRNWKAAAASWEKAYAIFPVRQWLAMKAAVAWLMADEPRESLRTLASLAAYRDGPFAKQANQILSELLKDFPEWAADVTEKTTAKLSGEEFELVRIQE